jgi:hypothetical protein
MRQAPALSPEVRLDAQERIAARPGRDVDHKLSLDIVSRIIGEHLDDFLEFTRICSDPDRPPREPHAVQPAVMSAPAAGDVSTGRKSHLEVPCTCSDSD